jgi:uncharacterized protein YeaO (DUF488 family)
MIRVKRAYDPVEKSDRVRILVDRLWPCGIKKEKLQGHLLDERAQPEASHPVTLKR